MTDNEFYTFREYMKKEDGPLTASMEDYLEMIYRLSRENGFTRIQDLAAALNVQPPSATKMVQKLSDINLVDYKRYGMIVLSIEGQRAGSALLARHTVIEDFLKILGLEAGVLEETEKIEHTISPHTVACLAELVSFFQNHPDLFNRFEKYRKREGKEGAT